MVRDTVSRRRFVALSGFAVTTPLLAGCGESGPGAEDSPDGDGDGDGAEDSPAPGDEEGTPGETDQSPGDQEEELVDLEPWQDVEDIELEGYTEGWEGVAPEPIEGETNPTLVLIEGNEYTVTWVNADGVPHDFTLYDDSEAAIDSTDTIDGEGEEASLTFEASQDIAQYICTVHPDTMIGDVEIATEGDGGGD